MYKTNIPNRNIAVCIILTLVTCGLYTLYWIVKLNDEVNETIGQPNATSGGMVILFTIITCGLYNFYWLYKMGERCDIIKGNPNGYTGFIYLGLSLLGLGILDLALIQDTLNKTV